jgi:hypothetical protein
VTIETETCSKLDERPDLRGVTRSSRVGGERDTFSTVQGAMIEDIRFQNNYWDLRFREGMEESCFGLLRRVLAPDASR